MAELSLVVPSHNEATHLRMLCERCVSVLEPERVDFEIVIVDDGSTDDSVRLVRELAGEDPRVRLVELARNFGKESAMLAGLDFASGRAIVILDADLQNPPEVVPAMLREWRAGAAVVDAVRTGSADPGLLRKWASRAFYSILARTANVPIVANASDFRLLDRRAADLLRDCRETHRFTRALVSWTGLPRAQVAFDAPARASGSSRWTLPRLVSYAFDALFSFGSLPLRLSGLLGLTVSIASFLYMLALVADRLINDTQQPGYASLAGGLFFLGGIQLLTIWVLGEYVGRIFEQSKQRPLYVVRRTVGFGVDHSA